MKQAIVKEVERVGYTYLDHRPLTNHPDDWYLQVVLAKNDREYVVWLYNATTNSLNEGNYLETEEQAIEAYISKK